MSESRDTPVTFSREEVRQIRDLMGTPHARVASSSVRGKGGRSCGMRVPIRGARRSVSVVTGNAAR